MLELRDISVSYGPVQAVRGFSLELMEGQIVSVVGANGAGKSSLMRAVAGLTRPSAGQILLDGRRIDGSGAPDRVRAGIALSPEGRRVFPYMTVRENLLMGAYAVRRARTDTLAGILDLFPRLRERLAQQAGSLSGGEQQMLAIGRALMAEPRFLLLDEPFLGLAPLITQGIARSIARLRAEKRVAILLVEQNARLALNLCDYAYVMSTGKVILSGDRATLQQSDAVVQAYLGHH